MAVINITALTPAVKTPPAFTYKDLHLDLVKGYSSKENSQLFKTKERSDLVADFDRDAIRTSIYNLLTTSAGERVLTPNYGLNLKKYLFIPVTTENALLIGEEIKTGIATWEPRITLQSVTIIADEDNNQYQITINALITQLQNTPVTLPGILSNSGFQYII